jgi:hypothetical protein
MASAVLDAQPRCDLDTLPCTPQVAYVEMDATLSAPGHFGHMGTYEREITATRFTYAAREARVECPQPQR